MFHFNGWKNEFEKGQRKTCADPVKTGINFIDLRYMIPL